MRALAQARTALWSLLSGPDRFGMIESAMTAFLVALAKRSVAFFMLRFPRQSLRLLHPAYGNDPVLYWRIVCSHRRA